MNPLNPFMKKLLLRLRFQTLFPLFLSTVFLLASGIHTPAQIASTQILFGSIRSLWMESPIQMTLRREGNWLSGSYVYTQVGQPIALRGIGVLVARRN